MSQVDDAFKAYAEDVASEEANRRAGGTGGAGYTPVKWTGLEKNVLKIVRAVGGVPDSDDSPYTARSVRIAYILNDKGKRIKVVLPDPTTGGDHLMWRIINRVMDVDWIDKKKYYVQEKKNPAIFNIVAYNGLAPEDVKRKFGLEGKGWQGREFFIMNCIDRSPAQYKWHQENKKTMLLAKSINLAPNKKGEMQEFLNEDGVPAYGFKNILATNIFKYYGDWRLFDIGIEKTGQMNTPYRIINAVKYIEEVPSHLQALVKSGPLTEEEASWEMYDLRKMYAPSTATKLYNNLKVTIRQIDDALGTNYASELKYLADEEAKARAATKQAEPTEDGEATEDESPEAPVAQTAGFTPPEAPARPVRGAAPAAEPTLPAYDKLTDAEKALIVSATWKGDKKWEIQYNTASQQYACPNCQNASPSEFSTCPACGLKF